DLVDLKGLDQAVAGVRQAIADIPQPEPVDLQPVIDEIHTSASVLQKAINAVPTSLLAKITDASENLKRTGTAIIDSIKQTLAQAAADIVAHTNGAIDRELGQKQVTLSLGPIAEKPKQPEPTQIDVRHLMNR